MTCGACHRGGLLHDIQRMIGTVPPSTLQAAPVT
jgi:hypothetical protein